VTRSKDAVVKHLYTDYFTRNEKLKTLQQFVRKEIETSQKNAVDLKRANQVLGNKIALKVREACRNLLIDG